MFQTVQPRCIREPAIADNGRKKSPARQSDAGDCANVCATSAGAETKHGSRADIDEEPTSSADCIISGAGNGKHSQRYRRGNLSGQTAGPIRPVLKAAPRALHKRPNPVRTKTRRRRGDTIKQRQHRAAKHRQAANAQAKAVASTQHVRCPLSQPEAATKVAEAKPPAGRQQAGPHPVRSKTPFRRSAAPQAARPKHRKGDEQNRQRN